MEYSVHVFRGPWIRQNGFVLTPSGNRLYPKEYVNQRQLMRTAQYIPTTYITDSLHSDRGSSNSFHSTSNKLECVHVCILMIIKKFFRRYFLVSYALQKCENYAFYEYYTMQAKNCIHLSCVLVFYDIVLRFCNSTSSIPSGLFCQENAMI